MTNLFKELFAAYCRDVTKRNQSTDESSLCAHLFIPAQTQRHLAEGIRRLNRAGEAVEVKILLRLLLPLLSYDDLMGILSTDDPPDEESFRRFLQGSISTDNAGVRDSAEQDSHIAISF